VLDTGAASRGAGEDKRDKERDVRAWFIEADLIEGVIHLPENLFYNTPAAGILLFLSKAKTASQRGRMLFLNAAADFVRSKPKNAIPDAGIRRIAETFSGWKEVPGYSRVVELEEVRRNHFNILPTRYVTQDLTEAVGNIGQLLAELRGLSREAVAANAKLDRALRPVLTQDEIDDE